MTIEYIKKTLSRLTISVCILNFWIASDVIAHTLEGANSATQKTATYLANEGVMLQNNGTKVLFDPFFHRHYNTYALVPEEMKEKIMNAETPFDNIRAIFVSHAHGDHFSDTDTLAYLQNHKHTQLFGPSQAIEQIRFLKPDQSVLSRLHPISLSVGDDAKTMTFENLTIEAVRIPHAGWPGRANVENLVFRVALRQTLNDESSVTVMHMGDADPNTSHFTPHSEHWQKKTTHLAFPPYWFYASDEGNKIVDELLNAQQSVGVHVPVKVPQDLNQSGKDFFSKPGESREIHSH